MAIKRTPRLARSRGFLNPLGLTRSLECALRRIGDEGAHSGGRDSAHYYNCAAGLGGNVGYRLWRRLFAEVAASTRNMCRPQGALESFLGMRCRALLDVRRDFNNGCRASPHL